ncbi:two-component regulator propeller domain-containing protein [Pedobacter sp. JCM 36344]|uniref:hybrid sensor histidine kinase/response regulator transcription factor n=1 Tax=Pedobacter sp. JCM 36344 TaxID=3374280 RepID=UPI00397B7EF0
MEIKNLNKLMDGKYVKALLLIFIFNIIGTNAIFSQSYSYKFNYLTVDEGLSHTDANDLAQDKHGYIWVATYFGLDRFDGYSVKKYYNNNVPLKNAYKNRIRNLYPDQDGKIWLSTEGGLQYFDPGSEQYIDLVETAKNSSPRLEKIIKPIGKLIYGLLAGTLKLYKIEGKSLQERQLSLPKNVHFSDMTTDESGQLYLSSNKGIWTLDKTLTFKKISIQGVSEQNFLLVSLDHQKHLLTVAGNTAYLINRPLVNGENFSINKQYSHSDFSRARSIVQNTTTDYWIVTGKNLIKLDNNFNYIQTISSKNSPQSLNSNSLTKGIIDQSGCLWVATFGGGVNYCDLHEKLFYTLKHNPEVSNSLSGNYVRSVLADGENLWIGTTVNGLNLYNLKTRNFTFYNSYNTPVKLRTDVITALAKDYDGNLWIGSNSGIEILKANKRELWKPRGYENFPTYIIETLVKDYYGNIWFGNHANKFGVIYKDIHNIYHVKYYDEGYFIFADNNKPQLFVSSTNGLKRITIDDSGNILKKIAYRGSSKPNSLSSDYTYPVSKQNDSTYWIGTIGGGLNRLSISAKNNYTIKTFNENSDIFKDVESLEIDEEGNIWMGGNGLQCFNAQTGRLIQYDKKDGLQGNSFKVGSSFKGADGRLYFGGISGLNYFFPKDIKANEIDARPILTDVLINNQKPIYKMASAIGYGPELMINHLQNNFVIFFSSMHFANPLKCRYRYKLVGFDKEWKFTDGRNPSAAYSNLDFNRYKFIVQATNNDGIWSKTQAETSIVITPPWWKSDLAKIVYLLIFILCLSAVYINQARWYRLKREIAVREVNENKREEMHKQHEELAEQQLMFFTNISHEFRTPLTLILGPMENLIRQNRDGSLDNAYQLMFRNAKRLLNLISELMNFIKVADQIIKLQVQEVPVHQFCINIAEEFETLASNKKIRFNLIDHTLQNNEKPLRGWFDVLIVEKILFNLLSNSFKYTEEGGQISFDVFTDMSSFKPSFFTGFQLLNEHYRSNNYIYFRISDSGIGISNESIHKIFERYYRISTQHLGSGVGLALVKSLTQLHKGDIYVYSEREKGTEIIIGIPLGEHNYDESEKTAAENILDAKLEPLDHSILIASAEHENDVQQATRKITKHILLVDDNRELRSFLKQTFEQHYFIYEAEDGSAGLDIATECTPDLIISDVMMPLMNGIEFCKLIKEKFETRHIPFIILSAKDALEAKIEGMESGADFYFGKPLSIELLLLTVQNIFEQAEKLKAHFNKNYLAEATDLVHTEKDKEFMNKLLALIEDNIKDPDLDVDFLCDNLYISRTKLYQKIKSISDQSVAEFIRTIRLKKAIQIMTHEDIPIYEVADRIGLQSRSNFSRAFKKEYGKSPLQYIQSLKN